jgi:transcription initiation factor IIE alpha subunit
MNITNNNEITNYQFWFETGLYNKVEIEEKEMKRFIYSLYQDDVIGYNTLLKSETTFSPNYDYIPSSINSIYEELTKNGLHKISL